MSDILVPNAKEAMERFKNEAAAEVGITLKKGYNGDLTSRQAGSIGGQMVKKMIPKRNLSYQRASRTADGHQITIRYTASIAI